MQIRKNILKLVIYGLMLCYTNGIVGAETEKPKLRWEYKYKEGETLMYMMKGRDWGISPKIDLSEEEKDKLKKKLEEWDKKSEEERKKENRELREYYDRMKIMLEAGAFEIIKGYEKDIEGVFSIRARRKIENNKWEMGTWTLIRKEGKEEHEYRNSEAYGEGVTGTLEFEPDGNVDGIDYLSVFYLGMPRFIESGLDMWSKRIELNEAIGQEARDRIKFTAHYRKLIGDDVIKGEKCVLIETEIGQVEDGTDEEKGLFLRLRSQPLRLKLYAKSWFSPDAGRVMKMDVEMKLYRQSGKEKKYVEWTGQHFTFELLDDKDMRKLDGIEDDWELVLPNVNNFQLTKDGMIVYVKEVRKCGSAEGRRAEVRR